MGKHSLVIHSHRTSVTLEDEFWDALKILAIRQNRSVAAIVTEIDDSRKANLSSALRVFILHYFMQMENDSQDGCYKNQISKKTPSTTR